MKIKVASRCTYETDIESLETSHRLLILLKLTAQLMTVSKFYPVCHFHLYVKRSQKLKPELGFLTQEHVLGKPLTSSSY